MSLKQRRVSVTVAALILGGVWSGRAAGPPMPIVVSVSGPGPYNLIYLPVGLISKIGADQAESAKVDDRWSGSKE